MKIVKFVGGNKGKNVNVASGKARKIAEMICKNKGFFNDHTEDGSSRYQIYAVGVTTNGDIIGLLDTREFPMFGCNKMEEIDGVIHLTTTSIGGIVIQAKKGERLDDVIEQHHQSDIVEIIYVPDEVVEEIEEELSPEFKVQAESILATIPKPGKKIYALDANTVYIENEDGLYLFNKAVQGMKVDTLPNGIVVTADAIDWTPVEEAYMLNRLIANAKAGGSFCDIASNIVADMICSRGGVIEAEFRDMVKHMLLDDKAAADAAAIAAFEKAPMDAVIFGFEFLNFVMKVSRMALTKDDSLMVVLNNNGVSYPDFGKILSSMKD